MSVASAAFSIDDAKLFDDNLIVFLDSLADIDETLASAIKVELPRLLRGEIDRAFFWDALLSATNVSAQP
jgi:hypothetical protein